MGNININYKYDVGIVSPSYKIFNVNTDVCNIDYFNEWIKSKDALYKYSLISEQGASIVRRNLNISLFNNIKVFLPDLDNQKKIGDFFKSLNKKKYNEENKLVLLKKLKKGLMQSMFV